MFRIFRQRFNIPLRTDRAWDYERYSSVMRPTEIAAFRNVIWGHVDDGLEEYRETDLEFNDMDWQIYLLLMELKGRVSFGHDDRSRKDSREVLKQICSRQYLNIPFPLLIIYHTDLLTKMIRRELDGLPPEPAIPHEQYVRIKAILKRNNI